MEVKKIDSTKGPKAIGPYSQGVELSANCHRTVYLSGMLPVNKDTGDIVGKTAAAQAAQSLSNIAELLADIGLSMANVVKTTVFLKSINDFAEVNKVYAEAFKDSTILPARSCFEVSALPKGALVEIEVVAVKTDN